MRRGGRAVFGTRDDLALSNRWWHRLATVLFVISSLGVLALAVVFSFREPEARVGNIRVVATLKQYTESHPELSNSVASFRAVGRVGAVDETGALRPLYLVDQDVVCSSNVAARPEDDEEEFAPLGQMWLRERSSNGTLGPCSARSSVKLPNSDRIVAWEFTSGAHVLARLRAFGVGVSVFLGFVVVVLNFYFRGIIYVVFGPRRGGSRVAEGAERKQDTEHGEV